MIEQTGPLHMNRWVRHERLYRHLLSLGLVVNPIFADKEKTQIDHLIVSVDLPLSRLPKYRPEEASQAGIDAVMQGAEIRQVVAPADGGSNNVVDFPPVLSR